MPFYLYFLQFLVMSQLLMHLSLVRIHLVFVPKRGGHIYVSFDTIGIVCWVHWRALISLNLIPKRYYSREFRSDKTNSLFIVVYLRRPVELSIVTGEILNGEGISVQLIFI